MQRAKAPRLGRLAALIAGLAILLQAVAAPSARAEVMELCTAHGIEKILVSGDAPVMPGDCEHCGHCVLIAPGDLPTARLQAPVRYGRAAVVAGSAAEGLPHAARAPPRPPGQAPPKL